MASARSWLFLDVDGVLNPFPDTPPGYEEYAFFPEDDEPVRLHARHRPWLHELAQRFELAWATGWGNDANRILSPHFGLPALPCIPVPPIPFEPEEKVPGVAALAGDRPAAWIDDMITDAAVKWASERAAPTRLVSVDSATGLTRAHVDEVLAWAERLPR